MMNDREYFDLPYNFVPLSGFVHRPADLAAGISQDVPFADGLCGVLDMELVALSDLLVSRGTERSGGLGQAHMFELQRPGGARKAIPSTSVRGMVRSVLEIASFGKMSRTDDRRFGVRDLNGQFYRRRITTSLEKPEFETHVRAEGYVPLSRSGWLYLKRVEGRSTWFIRECEYGRVDIAMLKRLGLASSRNASECRDEALQKGWIACEAEEPYLESHPSHSLKGRGGPEHLVFGHIDKVRRSSLSELPEDHVRGHLIFTNVVGKKKRQFFFYNSFKCEYPVDDSVMRAFFEVNPASQKADDGSAREQLSLWGYWKREILAGRVGPSSDKEPGIPIFFLGRDDPKAAGGTRILALGPTQMMKLPYDYSVRDMIRNTSEDHVSTAADLPEIIFGTAADDEGVSWRGRVTFSHLEAPHAEAGDTARLILNAPKPTFYPAYVEQPRAAYQTYLSPAPGEAPSEIRGWKRYQTTQDATHEVDLVYKPQRFFGDEPEAPPPGSGDKLATRLHPVVAGTHFIGRLHIHNLRPVELGALLWAMGLGENVLSSVAQRRQNHGIGMGKPFGFGRCAIRITGGELQHNRPSSPSGGAATLSEALSAAVAAFEDHMERHYADAAHATVDGPPPSWSESPQLNALRKLTCPEGHPRAARYLELIQKDWARQRPDGSRQGYQNRASNEFALKKKANAHLRPAASNVLDQHRFPRPMREAAEVPELPRWLRPGGNEQANEDE